VLKLSQRLPAGDSKGLLKNYVIVMVDYSGLIHSHGTESRHQCLIYKGAPSQKLPSWPHYLKSNWPADLNTNETLEMIAELCKQQDMS
jgi:hypothetical protein